MGSLEQLNSVERAKLLHALFRNEMPAFLRFARNTAVIVREQQAMYPHDWQNEFFNSKFWLRFAGDTADKIYRYGAQFEANGSFFSEQLFTGNHAMFMAHCLDQYRQIHTPRNKKFAAAIELFFSHLI